MPKSSPEKRAFGSLLGGAEAEVRDPEQVGKGRVTLGKAKSSETPSADDKRERGNGMRHLK